MKQLSIFVENKSGRLAEITAVLEANSIDIRALSVADNTDFGILRLIVDRPDEAAAALKKSGMTVSLNDVMAVSIPDSPGGFAAVAKLMADAGIGIEYMYAFISREKGRACVVLRVENNQATLAVLQKGGIELIPETDLLK